jgi:hypothetical protein
MGAGGTGSGPPIIGYGGIMANGGIAQVPQAPAKPHPCGAWERFSLALQHDPAQQPLPQVLQFSLALQHDPAQQPLPQVLQFSLVLQHDPAQQPLPQVLQFSLVLQHDPAQQPLLQSPHFAFAQLFSQEHFSHEQ